MKKRICLVLAAAGIVALMGAALSGCRTESEVTETTWPVAEAFENIRLEVNISDIQFTPSADGSCSVLWSSDQRIAQSVRVEGDTLVIRETPGKDRFSLRGPGKTPKITVQLPQPEYKDLTIDAETSHIDTTNYFTFRNVDIETSTGDIGCRCNVLGSVSAESDTGKIILGASQPTAVEVSSNTGSITLQSVVTSGDLEASSDVGQIYLSYVKAASAQLDTNLGPVTLDNVRIDGHLDINTDTAPVELRDADALTLEINTVTGDITGNLLTDKTFVAGSLGTVSVPDTTGGNCRLISDTGDIDIQIGEQTNE